MCTLSVLFASVSFVSAVLVCSCADEELNRHGDLCLVDFDRKIYEQVCVPLCLYACVSVCMRVCMHACACVHACVHACVCICVRVCASVDLPNCMCLPSFLHSVLLHRLFNPLTTLLLQQGGTLLFLIFISEENCTNDLN